MRGYGARWRAYSRRYLREHPRCASCGEQAEATDHVAAVTGPDDPGFWDPGNHQALCWGCHSRKTAKRDGGFGRRRG